MLIGIRDRHERNSDLLTRYQGRRIDRKFANTREEVAHARDIADNKLHRRFKCALFLHRLADSLTWMALLQRPPAPPTCSCVPNEIVQTLDDSTTSYVFPSGENWLTKRVRSFRFNILCDFNEQSMMKVVYDLLNRWFLFARRSGYTG